MNRQTKAPPSMKAVAVRRTVRRASVPTIPVTKLEKHVELTSLSPASVSQNTSLGDSVRKPLPGDVALMKECLAAQKQPPPSRRRSKDPAFFLGPPDLLKPDDQVKKPPKKASPRIVSKDPMFFLGPPDLLKPDDQVKKPPKKASPLIVTKDPTSPELLKPDDQVNKPPKQASPQIGSKDATFFLEPPNLLKPDDQANKSPKRANKKSVRELADYFGSPKLDEKPEKPLAPHRTSSKILREPLNFFTDLERKSLREGAERRNKMPKVPELGRAGENCANQPMKTEFPRISLGAAPDEKQGESKHSKPLAMPNANFQGNERRVSGDKFLRKDSKDLDQKKPLPEDQAIMKECIASRREVFVSQKAPSRRESVPKNFAPIDRKLVAQRRQAFKPPTKDDRFFDTKEIVVPNAKVQIPKTPTRRDSATKAISPAELELPRILPEPEVKPKQPEQKAPALKAYLSPVKREVPPSPRRKSIDTVPKWLATRRKSTEKEPKLIHPNIPEDKPPKMPKRRSHDTYSPKEAPFKVEKVEPKKVAAINMCQKSFEPVREPEHEKPVAIKISQKTLELNPEQGGLTVSKSGQNAAKLLEPSKPVSDSPKQESKPKPDPQVEAAKETPVASGFAKFGAGKRAGMPMGMRPMKHIPKYAEGPDISRTSSTEHGADLEKSDPKNDNLPDPFGEAEKPKKPAERKKDVEVDDENVPSWKKLGLRKKKDRTSRASILHSEIIYGSGVETPPDMSASHVKQNR